jgi:hypothetical protein
MPNPNLDVDSASIKKLVEVLVEGMGVVGMLNGQPDVPFDERAKSRVEHQERKRQTSIEQIAVLAMRELQAKEVAPASVDPDWLTRFFSAAQDVSNERMQPLWGRLLAEEVARPGTFTLRALDILRNLNAAEADMFDRFCGCVIGKHSVLLPFLQLTNLDECAGLSPQDLLRLEDAGLIDQRAGMWTRVDAAATSTIDHFRSTTLAIGNDRSQIVVEAPRPISTDFECIRLTPSGATLLKIVPAKGNVKYLRNLRKVLKARGFSVTVYEENAFQADEIAARAIPR